MHWPNICMCWCKQQASEWTSKQARGRRSMSRLDYRSLLQFTAKESSQLLFTAIELPSRSLVGVFRTLACDKLCNFWYDAQFFFFSYFFAACSAFSPTTMTVVSCISSHFFLLLGRLLLFFRRVQCNHMMIVESKRKMIDLRSSALISSSFALLFGSVVERESEKIFTFAFCDRWTFLFCIFFNIFQCWAPHSFFSVQTTSFYFPREPLCEQ